MSTAANASVLEDSVSVEQPKGGYCVTLPKFAEDITVTSPSDFDLKGTVKDLTG